jgi:hypothetical protein
MRLSSSIPWKRGWFLADPGDETPARLPQWNTQQRPPPKETSGNRSKVQNVEDEARRNLFQSSLDSYATIRHEKDNRVKRILRDCSQKLAAAESPQVCLMDRPETFG